MDANIEIRKLPPGVAYNLVQMLEVQDGWKKLMAIVPKNLDSVGNNQMPKYKVEHIRLVEQAGKNQRRPCAEIFLEEWGTSGRKRPDVAFLISLLGEVEMFRAADYLADLLEVPHLDRPNFGPSAPVDTSPESVAKLVVELPSDKNETDKMNNNECHLPVNTDAINKAINAICIPDGCFSSVPREETIAIGSREFSRTSESRVLGEQETLPLERIVGEPLQVQSIPHINFVELENCTDHFNEVPQTSGGRKLGSGAFGAVYLGFLSSQEAVAVKRLNKDAVNAEKQFCNEMNSLFRYRHPNLLRLMGYSCDSSVYCLVYEYMSNGSLQSRLACQEEEKILGWRTRLDVALGTARGILYLHTAYDKPLIHRDIKSANILLDEHLVAKLGDFGLVRMGQQQGNTSTLTTTVLGTSAYMAPEAFRGDVSIKLDTFSFGVVLLEILTGLPPYDEEREGHDLVTHIEAMCEESGSLGILLDKRAGDWGRTHSSLADNLYLVARNCIEDSRQKRPTMSPVVQWLEDIVTK